MPGPYVVPVHGDETLPEVVDVVVIGGGIVGVSTALELAERGQKVALCEKGGIGQEQSSRNWGWVRVAMRDPRELPLMIRSMDIWETLDERVGHDTGFTRSGIVYTSATEAALDERRRWSENLKGSDVPFGILSPKEIEKILGPSTMKFVGGFHTPADGRAEPQKASSAIAKGARAKGAHILTECAVRGLQLSGGKVSGVVTERGEIRCSAVVLAGGAWSNLFCGNAGIDLPQLRVLNSVLRTKPLPGGPDANMSAGGFAFRKRQDGGYTIADGDINVVDLVPDSFRYGLQFLPAYAKEWRSLNFRLGLRFLDEARLARRWSLDEPSPFEYNRVLDPVPSKKVLNNTLASLRRAFPFFEKAEIAQTWGGTIDVTPDAIPVIDKVDAIPGFHIATGFSGHGFGIGPAAGRLMADIVLGDPTFVSAHDFRFSRFTDGSKVRPISGF
ncbi:MAG: FAD-binding oxidoreductase [Rhodobacteraceae bacterium]|nr:FAD-binding oxidoreductase [Paracoccaceae bacterium]